MKRIFCLLLVICVFCFLTIISTNAMPAPCYFGDANADGKRDVIDATFVQENISKLVSMNLLQQKLSDVDADSKITIFDATLIQRKLAKTISQFPAGNEIYVYVLLGELICDPASKIVGVNEPVSITANPDGRCEPFTYDFYINDELIVEGSASNSFTYAFEETGTYSIIAVVTNTVGISAQTKTIVYVI